METELKDIKRAIVTILAFIGLMTVMAVLFNIPACINCDALQTKGE